MRKVTTADYEMQPDNELDNLVLNKVLNGCHNRQAWQDEMNTVTIDYKLARTRYETLCEAAAVGNEPKDEFAGFFQSDEEQFAGSPLLPLIITARERMRTAEYWVQVLRAVGENQEHIEKP